MQISIHFQKTIQDVSKTIIEKFFLQLLLVFF